MTVALLLVSSLAASARADVILFTASTDNSFGVNPVSVPGTNNPNIPTIDPGVTLNPNPALLDGAITQNLNGVDYGPFGFGGNAGGNTGWVNVSYTATFSSDVQLFWEVAGADYKIGSALAFDNVRVNGTLLFGFESGIPGDFTTNGTAATSGSLTRTDSVGNPLPDFAATEGSSFAFIDLSGNATPFYDPTQNFASQLSSSTFHLNAGDTISLDAAFLTNDGAPFTDYGIASLRVVPEPSSLVLLGLGLAGAMYMRMKGRFQERGSA